MVNNPPVIVQTWPKSNISLQHILGWLCCNRLWHSLLMFRRVSNRFPARAWMVARYWWSFVHWHWCRCLTRHRMRASVSQSDQYSPQKSRNRRGTTRGHGQYHFLWCHSSSHWSAVVFLDLYTKRSLDHPYHLRSAFWCGKCVRLHLCPKLHSPVLWPIFCVCACRKYAHTQCHGSFPPTCGSSDV